MQQSSTVVFSIVTFVLRQENEKITTELLASSGGMRNNPFLTFLLLMFSTPEIKIKVIAFKLYFTLFHAEVF